MKFEPTGSKVKMGASMSNSYDKENKNPAAFMGTGVVIMQIHDDKFEYDLYKVLRSNKDFYTAIADWISDPILAKSKYGHISDWDVSSIDKMDCAFQNRSLFNDDITSWNVRNVKSFNNMFDGAESFNQDISTWDIRNAITGLQMNQCKSMFDNGCPISKHFQPILSTSEIPGLLELDNSLFACIFSENNKRIVHGNSTRCCCT